MFPLQFVVDCTVCKENKISIVGDTIHAQQKYGVIRSMEEVDGCVSAWSPVWLLQDVCECTHE